MASIEVSGIPEVDALLEKLRVWANGGYREDMDNFALELAVNYVKQIRAGNNADGSPMTPLKQSTLDAPLRREGKSPARKTYGATPLYATGKTTNSISVEKSGLSEWRIAAEDALAARIINSNAKESHAGDRAFYGDVNKSVRDPLQVTDRQIDMAEDALVKSIEKALGI